MSYDKNAIGLVFKCYRKEVLKVKQRELAKEIGTTQGSISKIEKGLLEPSGLVLLNFFKIYKVGHKEFESYLDFCERELSKGTKGLTNDKKTAIYKVIANKISQI